MFSEARVFKSLINDSVCVLVVLLWDSCIGKTGSALIVFLNTSERKGALEAELLAC